MQFFDRRWPGARCTGIDGYLSALLVARERVPDARLLLLDLLQADAWIGNEKFDVITLLDVIEHLDEPVSLLKNLTRHSKQGGLLVVSVPAFPVLWSKRDVFLGHRKRYTKKHLLTELQTAGWEVLHCSYGFSFMFFPVFFLRKILFPFKKIDGQSIEASELRVVPVINAILRAIGMIEARVQGKVSVPFGTSLFCVARN